MSTQIRPEISPKNPYWIPKHRYYELKIKILDCWFESDIVSSLYLFERKYQSCELTFEKLGR